MSGLRSKPLLIAPVVPMWGIVAFFGAEQLHGTRYMMPFVFVMALAIVGLFAYVAKQAMRARRPRGGR